MTPITITALTDGSVEQARAWFTDPERIPQWHFASDDWSCPAATSDLRAGGAFTYRMAATDGSMAFDYAGTWEVVEADRLVQLLDDGRRVEITFTPGEAGTTVTEVFDPEASAPRDVQQAGWQAILHRFADVASGRPPITLQQLPARPLVGIRRTVPSTELGSFFAEVLPAVMGWLGSKGIAPASRPLAMWCAMDMETGIADCHAGCLVSEAVEGEGEITAGETAGGDVLTVTHVGPYSTVGRTWMAVYGRAAELKRRPGAGWEVYVDDPGDTPAEQLRTTIHLPVS